MLAMAVLAQCDLNNAAAVTGTPIVIELARQLHVAPAINASAIHARRRAAHGYHVAHAGFFRSSIRCTHLDAQDIALDHRGAAARAGGSAIHNAKDTARSA